MDKFISTPWIRIWQKVKKTMVDLSNCVPCIWPYYRMHKLTIIHNWTNHVVDSRVWSKLNKTQHYDCEQDSTRWSNALNFVALNNIHWSLVKCLVCLTGALEMEFKILFGSLKMDNFQQTEDEIRDLKSMTLEKDRKKLKFKHHLTSFWWSGQDQYIINQWVPPLCGNDPNGKQS